MKNFQLSKITKRIWEIYENNHYYFIIFAINPLNFFLSTLAKHKPFFTNYPSLRNKTNIVSPISPNQKQLFALDSSVNGDRKRQR